MCSAQEEGRDKSSGVRELGVWGSDLADFAVCCFYISVMGVYYCGFRRLYSSVVCDAVIRCIVQGEGHIRPVLRKRNEAAE